MSIDVVCNACRRNFKRECNKAYHKCITERSVQGQAGILHMHCNLDGSEAEEHWQCAGVGKRR